MIQYKVLEVSPRDTERTLNTYAATGWRLVEAVQLHSDAIAGGSSMPFKLFMAKEVEEGV